MSRSLAHVTLIERQPLSTLAEPARDGREIALTHQSVRILRELGVWPLIPEAEAHLLRQAKVLSGRRPFALSLTPRPAGSAAAWGIRPRSDPGFRAASHRPATWASRRSRPRQ
jgi:2-polyprenyl-6-methoxyphenol hydroxylase-like FAD-dependent oxidoreductase